MSTLKLKCPKCGGEEFKVPRTDLRHTDQITCNGCGLTDTYINIAGPQAREYAVAELKKALKGLKP